MLTAQKCYFRDCKRCRPQAVCTHNVLRLSKSASTFYQNTKEAATSLCMICYPGLASASLQQPALPASPSTTCSLIAQPQNNLMPSLHENSDVTAARSTPFCVCSLHKQIWEPEHCIQAYYPLQFINLKPCSRTPTKQPPEIRAPQTPCFGCSNTLLRMPHPHGKRVRNKLHGSHVPASQHMLRACHKSPKSASSGAKRSG